MSISSFNLSREARAEETRGTMIISIELCRISTTIDRPYARPIFGLRCTTVSDQNPRKQSTAFALERSKLETNMEKSEGASSEQRSSMIVGHEVT